MKRSNKYFMLVIMITVIFLAGCNKFSLDFNKGNEEKTPSDAVKSLEEIGKLEEEEDKDETGMVSDSSAIKSDTQEEKANESASSETTTPTETPTEIPIQPSANIDLPIYIVNAETAEIEPVTALIPEDSEITPELIVATVIESMADQEIILATDQVTTEGKAIVVSFIKDKSPASDMGAGYEIAILDAITLSLTDNLKNYDGVIFRLEGKAYQSGHIELGINELWN